MSQTAIMSTWSCDSTKTRSRPSRRIGTATTSKCRTSMARATRWMPGKRFEILHPGHRHLERTSQHGGRHPEERFHPIHLARTGRRDLPHPHLYVKKQRPQRRRQDFRRRSEMVRPYHPTIRWALDGRGSGKH